MITNRETLIECPEHEVALDCIQAAIDAVQPESVTNAEIELENNILGIADAKYNLTTYDEVVIVGGGKAAGGIIDVLGPLFAERLSDSMVVTKHKSGTTGVRCIAGDHPLPTEQNVRATSEILDIVQSADERTLVLFVLTGGASALMTAPAGELGVADIRNATEQLLASGVPIDEINAVRKHLSESKGGRIVRKAAPATVAGLIMSDVVGNDLSTIGSGPTVPDTTTFSDALAVFKQHNIDPPKNVRSHLEHGIAGEIPETPFPDASVFDHVDNHILSDNTRALDAAWVVARKAGYTPILLSSRMRGEAKEIAKPIVAVGEEIAATGGPVDPPAVFLWGGESTVTISENSGIGGPNQEFALSAALELGEDMVLAAIDTDGEDGSSEVAGAIVDTETVNDSARVRSCLEDNDAGTYLADENTRIRTGPTGTNVNDVIVGVIPETST